MYALVEIEALKMRIFLNSKSLRQDANRTTHASTNFSLSASEYWIAGLGGG